METTRSQRWRDRRARYVDDTNVVDPRLYAVDVVDHEVARAFIAAHHYLPNYPAAQLAVGLFGYQGTLCGVAVFAVPVTSAVITTHAGFPHQAQGCVLARLILLDAVPQNGESFFLSRAFKMLRREKPSIEAVISYSDPAAGHIGRCYAALSSAYRGRTRPRIVLRAGGTTIAGRTLSKIRLGERGDAGAIDQLVRLGLPSPGFGEDPRQWLQRLRHERHLLTHCQEGLFTYCFELTREARRRGHSLPRLPYPKMLPSAHPTLPFFDTAADHASGDHQRAEKFAARHAAPNSAA